MSEPTPEQVEAAAKVIAGAIEGDAFYEYPFAEWRREEFRTKARAALEAAARAAQGAAPQAEIHEPNHDRVYCVRCGGNWPCQAPQAESVWIPGYGGTGVNKSVPELPSSTVGEGELEHRVEEVIRDVVDMPLSTRLVLARAVVEAIGGETRAVRE